MTSKFVTLPEENIKYGIFIARTDQNRIVFDQIGSEKDSISVIELKGLLGILEMAVNEVIKRETKLSTQENLEAIRSEIQRVIQTQSILAKKLS